MLKFHISLIFSLQVTVVVVKLILKKKEIFEFRELIKILLKKHYVASVIWVLFYQYK